MEMKIIVLGKVSSPGTLHLKEGAQILDVLSAAGGASGRAAVGKTYIIRVVNGEPIVIHSDLKALINRADLRENVEVKDGDIVFVPETSRVNLKEIINNLSTLNLIRSTVQQFEEKE